MARLVDIRASMARRGRQYRSSMEHQDVEAHEHRAIEEVRVRLAQRFPDVERTDVDRAVDDALAGITGPVRDFVPILVERAAAQNLSSMSRRPAELPEDAG